MPAAPGIDDRLSRGGYLSRAEELMADAVGAPARDDSVVEVAGPG
ncbi:hypothetical protein AB0H42_17450 [Nocardia sp. NPDC050799]